MISTTIKPQTPEVVLPFPKLMILTEHIGKDDPLIVLFKKEKEGTVLTNTHDWSIGGRDTDFAMHYFTDFQGTLQLENGA